MGHSIQNVGCIPRPFLAYLVTHTLANSILSFGMSLMRFNYIERDSHQYWVATQPSSSTERTLVLFHGIGGLLWYLPFIREITKSNFFRNIIVLLIPHVSLRFPKLGNVPTMDDTLQSLHSLFDSLRIKSASFIGHSYGTVILSWVIQKLENFVDSAIFIDPICFELVNPDIVFNFVYRSPDSPFQLLLWYFVSKEIGVSYFVCRHFWWYQNILFPSKLPKKTAVFLGGKDCIINSNSLLRYLESQNIVCHYEPDHNHGAFLADKNIWREILISLQVTVC